MHSTRRVHRAFFKRLEAYCPQLVGTLTTAQANFEGVPGGLGELQQISRCVIEELPLCMHTISDEVMLPCGRPSAGQLLRQQDHFAPLIDGEGISTQAFCTSKGGSSCLSLVRQRPSHIGCSFSCCTWRRAWQQ
eukprot:365676-Chlamydomonas_euryale.AAC.3